MAGIEISEEIRALRDIQMQMLNKLLEVCKKYNLKIWADSGTLIGTIRHKGFIPWDDDIDMAMLRKDYDKLVAIAESEFKSPFFFQSFETEKGCFYNGSASIRMDGTTAIVKFDRFASKEVHKGVFVDIFILDDMPNDEEKRAEMVRNVAREKKVLLGRAQQCRFPITLSLSYVKKYFRYRMGDEEFKRRGENLQDYIKSFASDDSEYVCPILFSQSDDFLKHYLLKKEWYADTVMLPFENMMMPVPKGYHEILTKIYGDYMTPVKEPTVHGGYDVLDLHKSYKEYA